MWTQFFLENAHFAINIIAAMVFFAAFWLYFDAWLAKRSSGSLPKFLGFFILSISFLLHSVFMESEILTEPILGISLITNVFLFTRILGYLLLIVSLSLEPLQRHPKGPEHEAEKPIALSAIGVFGSSILLKALFFPIPILSASVAIFYLRRATIGLEKHIKPISLGFFVITSSEAVSLASLFRDARDISIYNLVSAFGPLWILEHTLLFIGISIIGIWVWGYLLRRLITQLYLIFTFAFLFIFLITTVTFSAILIKNLEGETLSRLQSDVKVLNLALDSKNQELLSDAGVISQNDEVKDALRRDVGTDISDILEDFLITKGENILVVVDSSGQVIARGEDRERIGESLSNDPLIARALIGEEVTSAVSRDAVLAPEISLRSAVPVKDGEEVIGAVLIGGKVDNTFVDGVRRATGLEAGIYADNILSATTIVAQDGKSRPIGIKEKDQISQKVLTRGETYTGSVNILGTPYLGAYVPLFDLDNVPVGMLFVGTPQVGVLQTAAASIELTFVFAAVLIAFSIIPSYLIARYLTYQIR